MRTAILIAKDDALLALHPTTDVERKLVALMSGEVEVSLHHSSYHGLIGGIHRHFQGLGGELIVVAKPKAEAPEPRPEVVTPPPEDTAPRPAQPTYNEVVKIVVSNIPYSTMVSKIFELFARPAPGPSTTTPEPRVCDGECWRGRPMVSEVENLVSKHRCLAVAGPDAVKVHLSQTVQLIFSLFLGHTATKVEDPEPNAGVLQTRRDVRWLKSRGLRGQTHLSEFTVADLAGLSVTDLRSITSQSRQLLTNRALNALKYLNSGETP